MDFSDAVAVIVAVADIAIAVIVKIRLVFVGIPGAVVVDVDKVFVNIQSYGNTSAATIPVALTEALEQGRIHPGDNVAFTAFGGGLSWGSAVFRWGERVEPLGESDAELPPPDRTTLELLQPNFDFFGLPEKLT